MSKLTLEEAISHCLEVAEENDLSAETYEILAENNHNAYEKLTAETNSSRCAECAADHRQLAEWLTELKEAKRLLKVAVEGFDNCADRCICDDCDSRCPFYNFGCVSGWKHRDEALALIGEDGDTND